MDNEFLLEAGKWFLIVCVAEFLLYKLITRKSSPKVIKLRKQSKKRDPAKDAIYNPKEFRRPRS